MRPWRTMSSRLMEVYGEKVYKIPIKLQLTCPNRDGTAGRGGCIFCGEEGGSFENEPAGTPIHEQLARGRKRLEKIGPKKYIAYLQNFSNTYMPVPVLKNILTACLEEDITGIAIATRPDCFREEHADLLQELQRNSGREITVELGLQSPNHSTLKKINRGHSPADYVRAQLLLRDYGLRSCVHLIPNLPWDNKEDAVEAAKLVSALGVDEVKLHALYIVKDTALGRMYERGEIRMGTKEEYQETVILFLRHLSEDMVVQRVIGRAPKKNALFCNWNTSWWKIRDEIASQMVYNGWKQGDLREQDRGILLSDGAN
ncbi:MAG: TIGR01212 family radical SAM protein [Tissierellia bacterium]|nr:TIGR01212 family radical SAM protein [Tissierellia bacterium]